MEARTKSGLHSFDPPRDAEPSALEGNANGDQIQKNGEAEVPTVLTKLQKWADYPSIGNPVCPTNFLPMKTPMSLEIISNWSLPDPPKHRLTVPDLISTQQDTGRCVGMIIDLANHECLYADDIPESLEYTHIQLVAKVLPPPEAIDQVAAAAAEFWSRRPDDFIAIHCAYGFNRTGFVVCSYLCQVCGLSVPEALKSFAAARPPGVKHGKFVDELYARYGGVIGGEVSDQSNTTEAAAIERGERERTTTSAPGTPTSLLALQLRRQSASFTRKGSGDASVQLKLDQKFETASVATTSDEGCPSSPSGSAKSANIPIPFRSRSGRSLLGGSNSSRSLTTVPESGDSGGAQSNANNNTNNSSSSLIQAEEEGKEERVVGNYSAMAQHLDGKSLMRRETSLGLAKALHEDFGVHENTPSKQNPSPLMDMFNQEAAVVTVDGVAVDGEQATPPQLPNNNNSNMETPASTSHTAYAQQQQQQYQSGGGGSSVGAMPRNLSIESDCHSLGFNAREALQQLRLQDGIFNSPLPEESNSPTSPNASGSNNTRRKKAMMMMKDGKPCAIM